MRGEHANLFSALHTRWFKATFLSISRRSLNLWSGHLTIQKKVTKNCHEQIIWWIYIKSKKKVDHRTAIYISIYEYIYIYSCSMSFTQICFKKRKTYPNNNQTNLPPIIAFAAKLQSRKLDDPRSLKPASRRAAQFSWPQITRSFRYLKWRVSWTL